MQAIRSETALGAAREALMAAREALTEELREYPRPVSGCDAQFNHLLAERRRVDAALAALGREVRVPTSRAPWGVAP